MLLSKSTSWCAAAADRQAAAWGCRISHGVWSISNLGHPCHSDPRERRRRVFPHLAVFLLTCISNETTLPMQLKEQSQHRRYLMLKMAGKGQSDQEEELTFPKFAAGGWRRKQLKLHEHASFGRVRCLHDQDTKGELMAGRSCHHVRKSGAEPAAHTIRVISAGGCSLPCRHLGSELTCAGGEPAPRPDLADNTTLWALRLSNWQPTHLSANKPTPPRLRE